ncbi:MAG: hypothetical protein V1799_15670 [bacterium]
MEPANTESIHSLADWCEYLVASNQHELSKAKITSLLSTKQSGIDEDKVDSILSELDRRIVLYGSRSPYTISNNILIPNTNWKDCPEYMMCLIFSLTGVVKIKGQNDGTKLFENLSREVIISYLGGEAEVIGFPNSTSLTKQIENISKNSNEQLGQRKPKPKDKDKGVDIIAWKSHGDTRDNQLVILLQSGAGMHFDSKKPISITAWHEFINWSANPIPGIIIPIIVPTDEWIEVRDDYNLIFDRARILRALTNRQFINRELRPQILAWCNSRIN